MDTDEKGSDDQVLIPATPLQIEAGTVVDPDTGPWIHYLGILELPFSTRAEVHMDGTGLQITPHDVASDEYREGNLRFVLSVTADTGETVYVYDVILLPVDNMAHVKVRELATNASVSVTETVIDNTGYLSHGEIRDSAFYICTEYSGSTVVNQARGVAELYGNAIKLLPGELNRLYFTLAFWPPVPASSDRKIWWDDGGNMHVRVNIVPRSLGPSYA